VQQFSGHTDWVLVWVPADPFPIWGADAERMLTEGAINSNIADKLDISNPLATAELFHSSTQPWTARK
jgi:hypothetical protein